MERRTCSAKKPAAFLESMLVVAVAAALSVPAPAIAGGPISVTWDYKHEPKLVPGFDTGFGVKDGLPVTVTATGTVKCTAEGFNEFCIVGPDGDPDFDTTTSPLGGFLLPGAPAWGLVARAGDGPWTHVGSGPTELTGNGNLVFAVNDDLYPDNLGSFTATVSYFCYPGKGNGDQNHYHCGPPGQD